jgi:hypothetical protein
MYITEIPNRTSPPAVLLRESYREGGKVRTRTLANLSSLTPRQITGMKRALRDEDTILPDGVVKVRDRSHGAVDAVQKVGSPDALVGDRRVAADCGGLRWPGHL